MEAQLTSEVNPTNFAKWIGDCVEVKFHTNPEFVMALIQVVFKHIGNWELQYYANFLKYYGTF